MDLDSLCSMHCHAATRITARPPCDLVCRDKKGLVRWRCLLRAEMLEEDARGVLEALVMRQMTNIRQDVDVRPA
jgi:hypothetical protein